MIGYASSKVKKDYHLASVALRLIVEAVQAEAGCPVFVFRVDAPTRFEDGVHSTGMAMDVKVSMATEKELSALCSRVNKKFPVPGAAKNVCTLKADPHNLPNGKRVDTPHIHVQIPFDWKAEPRAFLEAHGYLEGLHKPN